MEDLKTPKYTIVGSASNLDLPLATYRDLITREMIPVAQPAESQGKENLLSKINLMQVEAFKLLKKAGLSREAAKKIIKHIDEYRPSKPVLIASLSGATHMWVRTDEKTKPLDFVIQLDVSRIHAKINELFS